LRVGEKDVLSYRAEEGLGAIRSFFQSKSSILIRRLLSSRKSTSLMRGRDKKRVEEIDRSAEKKQVEIQLLREKQQSLLREKDKFEFQVYCD